ncbi:ankyrin repeat domain-containing protein SOWAHB [Elgaria multicarinata webbii]|uniref:ankyrin repeat domain-containing protein SOWAHB n=1 Tax=Elgaria multicarinata webbii TaxID=159646 RepID=UPI002FCD0B0B
MAKELSQAELLDFLCQAGGRVANADLLGHFRGFLRDPEAGPAQLQLRRERFKGFVNSVATVRQEGPDAAKYVVLRKRYRELVGEELKPPAEASASPAAKPPPEVQVGRAPQGQPGSERAPRAHGCGSRGESARPQVEEARTCRGSARERRACPGPRGRLPGGLGGRSGAPPPPSPTLRGRGRPSERCALLGAEERRRRGLWQAPPGDPLSNAGGALMSNGPCLPVGAMGAPPSGSSPQQRIRDWVVTHHSAPLPARSEEGPWPAQDSPSSGPRSISPCPAVALEDSEPGQLLGPSAAWQEPVPVFRSIRCQLSLQDLEDFIEQESSASEDGSSTSGGSESYRLEGEVGTLHRLPGRQNGQSRTSTRDTWTRPERLCPKPSTSGLDASRGAESGAQLNGAIPTHLNLLSRVIGRASKRPSKDLPKPRQVSSLPPPNLDAPLSPRLVPRQRHWASTPDVAGSDAEGSTEQRSSLVPLEPREHAWLVKVATGSWMQARALLLEDPQLAIRKDFISGYTVLHWLARHGNAQVMQDFVAGAQKAGVTLDVNAKSGCGYTPLHLAAMHGHQPVIKLLVQKLQGRIQIRDSSGKRPWQYLSSATSGEVWQLLGAPRGKTIFPAHPIVTRNSSSPTRKGKSPELARKISRKTSLAAYLKPQHIKWKMANRCPPLQEREEYSD